MKRLYPRLRQEVDRFGADLLVSVFATGAGAYGRHSVGTAIVGGMVLSTVLNLFFIPVLYVILKTILVKFSGKKVVTRSGQVPPPQPIH